MATMTALVAVGVAAAAGTTTTIVDPATRKTQRTRPKLEK
jgi:hypothetical protein